MFDRTRELPEIADLPSPKSVPPYFSACNMLRAAAHTHYSPLVSPFYLPVLMTSFSSVLCCSDRKKLVNPAWTSLSSEPSEPWIEPARKLTCSGFVDALTLLIASWISSGFVDRLKFCEMTSILALGVDLTSSSESSDP